MSSTFAGADHIAHVDPLWLIGGRFRQREARVPQNPRQQIIEIVSDAAGQQAKTFELLAFLNLPEELPAFRDIADVELNHPALSLGVNVGDDFGLNYASVSSRYGYVREAHDALFADSLDRRLKFRSLRQCLDLPQLLSREFLKAKPGKLLG